ncbi:ABC transporter ATP-binding protein [Clostridium sp. 19966]|uniref:ABC transporter ATP-binding protein n=1 Tax=Clostridium sp. 19966 TaxID=2768166 RepID=UPI0028DF33A0|nr:ABC transporter ATP-binding protein [Clostridium sp. 19966]MDT8719553.1 ABC transporter ATP-binding protein [Clostridium sp. 19966]
MNVLEVSNVYKKLGKREIIKGISFDIKEGEIFGFLGPNGAGKTTTIRMLVGLIHPNKGNIRICGNDILKSPVKALSNVGAVVENPELYTYISGRQNLNMIAAIKKIPKKNVDETIDLVGLSGRIDDKVKKYSLGMKQRLGLATALLSKPKLLILDEPTNGLDPTGIIDFREIVKKTAKETNAAVFISSHILSEIQQLCDTVAFINGGQIKSIENISGGDMHNETDTLAIVTKDISNGEAILNKLEVVREVAIEDNIFTVKADRDTSNIIIKELVAADIDVTEVYKTHKGLEQRYMELVEGGKR